MINNEKLPLSLRLENAVLFRRGMLLITVLFLLMYLPWLISGHELYRQEGIFAAVAADYVDHPWNPEVGITAQAHNMPHSDLWPLYPAVVSLFYRCGVPMENALRIISVLLLGVLSLLSGLAAGLRCGKRAGLVAACCCFGTLFSLEKSVYGGPETMAACFLLAAQLLFFHYGSRLADWNSAWIASAVLLSLGFLTCGPVVLLFFVVPLFFLRRPLSFAGKFRTPGFLVGMVLLLMVVLMWAFPFGFSLRHYAVSGNLMMISTGKYWEEVLLFPLLFPLRMLPWSLLMWMPFCVALQAISPLPVFSRYLRTLFFSMLALAWLIPGASSKLIFFLLGPLSILTGLTYELGVRRYGVFLRKALLAGGFFFPLAAVAVLAVNFLPESFLSLFGESEKMQFRQAVPGYLYYSLVAIICLLGLNVFFSTGHRRFPIWVQLSLLCCGISIVAAVEFLPYRMMDKGWRTLGDDVRAVLPEETSKLYKYDIDGMYCGLFYVGKPIYQLQSLDELNDLEDTVYVISSGLPLDPGRVWTALLPDDYVCRDVPVSVWRGVRRKDNWMVIDE
ncbi:MAG: hypothetical protein E7053_05825 [Lentisphaerae bacterium]|nr:hypothetical protein [Lentisphaerota bacterium]